MSELARSSKRQRPSFQIKRTPMGDRLIWRYPGGHPEIRRQLERDTGLAEIPSQITLGYFRLLPDPPGAPAFMPVNTPLAVAALAIEMVQIRICEDLAMYVRRQQAHDPD